MPWLGVRHIPQLAVFAMLLGESGTKTCRLAARSLSNLVTKTKSGWPAKVWLNNEVGVTEFTYFIRLVTNNSPCNLPHNERERVPWLGTRHISHSKKLALLLA